MYIYKQRHDTRTHCHTKFVEAYTERIMHWFIDLRYAVPPIINLFREKLLAENGNWEIAPIFMMASLVFAALILLFVCTSVKLPLTVEPIQLRVGSFSAPLTVSLLASLILPPSLFWVAFSLLTIVSPWYPTLLDLLKRFMCWLSRTLHAFPTFIITCVTQRPQEILEQAPPRVEIWADDTEGSNTNRNFLQIG